MIYSGNMAMYFGYWIRNYSKHALLSQDMLWGAKCYPIFWSKLEYQQIGKELWISGLEVGWNQGCDRYRQNFGELRSGRN